MKKTVFITGATSGIGAACASAFAKAGHRLVICGRREDRLSQMTAMLAFDFDAEVFAFPLDVRNPNLVKDAIAHIPAPFADIDILVNNAGLASGLAPINEGELMDWERMIDTNVKGLLYVTREIAPRMIAKKSGHIINIGSVAGKEVYPNGNVYCATKHAVDALTKGMRLDFLPHNIRVSQVSPGMVETEFSAVRFHGDTTKAAAVYEGYQPLKAIDIADAVMYMANVPPHVCINDIWIMPTTQANSYTKVKA